jgi:asparagine synthetase B (glutamine-hydrolysing)
MREDMDDMSNGIAKHFGITNHRPYQDNKEIDDMMYNLPREEKIYNVEFGKYALRLIAENYLPEEIAWRKKKMGGPIYPVNIKRGWVDTDGEFGKTSYLNYQKDVLTTEA